MPVRARARGRRRYAAVRRIGAALLRGWWRLGWRGQLEAVALAGVLVLTAGAAVLLWPTAPPPDTGDLCAIFDYQPRWYDYARAAEQRWGTPIAVQMAIVRQESSFRQFVRPPRQRLWGFIPWRRPSSAYGYAQAVDPTWGEYLEDAGEGFARRTHMRHALDFVGWYNQRSHSRLGLDKTDARRLYIAYHEGHAGYRRGHWRDKPFLLRAVDRVERTAAGYARQLAECEERFRCRRFWQVGPFCRQ